MTILGEILALRRLGLNVDRELRSERHRLMASSLQDAGNTVAAQQYFRMAEDALERRVERDATPGRQA